MCVAVPFFPDPSLSNSKQHGKPLQILDMGETAIDKDTFEEYLNEMRQHYTADKVRLVISPNTVRC